MKIPSIILLLLLSFFSLSAQDIITASDGATMEARVVEVSPSVVKYYKFNQQDGPLYSVPTEYLSRILYQNGTVDYFNEQAYLRNWSENLSEKERERIFELIRNGVTAEQLNTKARRMRVTGWVGAGILFVGGVVVGALLDNDRNGGPQGYYSENLDIYTHRNSYIAMGVGGALALGWSLGFNVYANKLYDRAKLLEFLTAPLIRTEVMTIGKSNLSAGIDMLSCVPARTRGIGLSLNLSF